ncbi:MAG TPA: GNAT family N-acetyltransferase [Actinophytocola sp.]|uniref:GNAT family N-acetyltransferase n=1 Tax=Actinophytocola sp. TaxID=1872138 RepID=UPI002DBBF112|nr:GNAT family N-acetyltransferase [Actinophytocola sp.]HEU5474676.1 GNAT family N-acetyltransferase [Actinophytocola sp.]
MSADLLGHRVVLRRRAGERDGRPVFADILGHLVDVSGAGLVVRRDDGTRVSVPAAEVHRLRAVPPGRADIVGLERVAAASWPAPETAALGQWLLRAGEGWTRRANSALVLGDPGLPVLVALDRVRDWYVARNLVPRLAVPLPTMAAADRVAARSGWEHDVVTEVLVRPVSPAPPDPEVRFAPVPDAGWAAVYQARSVPPVANAILTGPPVVTFGSLVQDGVPVAIGRGVVDGDWLGIAAMETLPGHRRRGLAARMLRALLGWGAAHGAVRCYLQVEDTNAAARALYTGLGFVRHHRYRLHTG